MQHLDPKAVWLFFFQSFVAWLLVYIFLISNITGLILMLLRLDLVANIFIIIFSFLLTVGLSFFVAKLSYKYYKYELTPDGFKKESGIIWKRYVTIPYERIQNVDIYRGIFTRLLGLSDLHIQTAGNSGIKATEGRLPGLSRTIAEQLRDELVSRSKTQHSYAQQPPIQQATQPQTAPTQSAPSQPNPTSNS